MWGSKCMWSSVCWFFFSSRRRHTRFDCDWSSDVCSSDLSLRGTRDFATRDEYAEFLRALLQRRNGLRRERLATELAVLRPLPALRLEDRSEERRVGEECRSRWSPDH